MASVRALQAKAREISFGPLPGGLPAACFATWSAFSFPSTPACPGTHWIVGWRPWVCSLLAIASAWVANEAAWSWLGMSQPCNGGTGVQLDSDWSLISHFPCYLECPNNSKKLCVKTSYPLSNGILGSSMFPPGSCHASPAPHLPSPISIRLTRLLVPKGIPNYPSFLISCTNPPAVSEYSKRYPTRSSAVYISFIWDIACENRI